MKWYWGLTLSVILVVITVLISEPLVEIMILMTSLWAAFDSAHINLRKYKSGISIHPVLLFFGILFIWIVAFPWYLHVRYQITHGLAELKEAEHIPTGAPDSE
ncbi:hypothetical protein ACFL27_13755 [candidate division CSSED10-310 bacterium]|uniref:DUF420 domain-containing protein n=1 Tax=candidate division CSSED10-310 bacterium TaxID=2855610 RepID=A0ABV6YYI2_UNCC1